MAKSKRAPGCVTISQKKKEKKRKAFENDKIKFQRLKEQLPQNSAAGFFPGA